MEISQFEDLKKDVPILLSLFVNLSKLKDCYWLRDMFNKNLQFLFFVLWLINQILIGSLNLVNCYPNGKF